MRVCIYVKVTCVKILPLPHETGRHSFMFTSHCEPLNPAWQLQLKPLTWSIQVPCKIQLNGLHLKSEDLFTLSSLEKGTQTARDEFSLLLRKQHSKFCHQILLLFLKKILGNILECHLFDHKGCRHGFRYSEPCSRRVFY